MMRSLTYSGNRHTHSASGPTTELRLQLLDRNVSWRFRFRRHLAWTPRRARSSAGDNVRKGSSVAAYQSLPDVIKAKPHRMSKRRRIGEPTVLIDAPKVPDLL